MFTTLNVTSVKQNSRHLVLFQYIKWTEVLLLLVLLSLTSGYRSIAAFTETNLHQVYFVTLLHYLYRSVFVSVVYK